MFRTDDTPDPSFSETLELDLSGVEPSVAGPRRPQDRVALGKAWASFTKTYGDSEERFALENMGADAEIGHGSVVIAAITSCTNTSNPSVMLAAGLLAKKAVERGLSSKPWVKTSMAPGSRVVTEYLEGAGLVPYLEKLGFHVVGYGCTTCIGNSGPLPPSVEKAIDEHNLSVVSVLSGNRNFEGRIHPQVKASYLASPPLVVAYALAGHANVDLTSDPLGYDAGGDPIYMKDLWPAPEEILQAMAAVKSEMFTGEYSKVFDGTKTWHALPSPEGALYKGDERSTYVQEPPFFTEPAAGPVEPSDIRGARVLAFVGDSVTTDHISPAGSIAPSSPAGKYLIANGVEVRDFNSYGSRRGNHEVMMRGTFANIRLRNRLAGGKEGGFTVHLPGGEPMTIYDAAMKYEQEGVPLLILAGKEYGSGSSRDWAAKGVRLQGVRAVLAESYERIHRSNLVGMGVLPLQYLPGENADSLGLTGAEVFDVTGISGRLRPSHKVTITARGDDGRQKTFEAGCRIDSDVELEYYRHGGVLQYVLRKMLTANA
jgi:aconitate hydratase